MQSIKVQRLALRMLLRGELSGYDIWKEMSMKGLKIKTNYLYMILTDMRRKGLLSARWLENSKGPRKRLYSLSDAGREEFERILRESVEFVVDAFVQSNAAVRNNMTDHVRSVRNTFRLLGIPTPQGGSNLVITAPSFDPLLCHPISYYVISQAFPEASVSVVRPPEHASYFEGRPNLTFLDGRRQDIPLKNNFADYLMLEGFPRSVPLEATLNECVRVLKPRGHLIIRLPAVMLEEKKPNYSNLAEYAYRLYYDYIGEDMEISSKHLKSLLEKRAIELRDAQDRSNYMVYVQISKRRNISG
ncbi:MAG: helix-turn-helix transcriptional regulator [Nitrososphaerota archaeon]|nr:helix-turn-helix transcriptional regulator [Nitrososphaerota archaeon]